MKLARLAPLALSAALFAVPAFADENPSTLYELSTAGSSSQVKAGQKGKWVLAIQPKAGAHVSDDAPMKIELSGTNVKVEKDKLGRQDAANKDPAPRFEVAFSTATPGKGTVDAKLTFFICTEKICARQQRTVSVPVDVL